MSEIPDDVLRTAEEAWELAFDNYQGDHDCDPIGVIARAILAERERCAKIAYTYASGHSDTHKFAGHSIGRLILFNTTKE